MIIAFVKLNLFNILAIPTIETAILRRHNDDLVDDLAAQGTGSGVLFSRSKVNTQILQLMLSWE